MGIEDIILSRRQLGILTISAAVASIPQWSHAEDSLEGTITFSVPSELKIYNLDIKKKMIREIQKGGDPRLSADGKWVAYSRRVGRTVHIFYAQADGTGERHFDIDQPGNGGGQMPSFTPDNNIIFAYNPSPNGMDYKCIVQLARDDLKGKKMTEFYKAGIGRAVMRPIMSPDEKYIAFAERPSDIFKAFDSTVHILDVKSGNVKEYGKGGEITNLHWIEDELFYESDSQVIILKPDGSKEALPFTLPGGFCPSPSGKKILYIESDSKNKIIRSENLLIYDRASKTTVNCLTHEKIKFAASFSWGK